MNLRKFIGRKVIFETTVALFVEKSQSGKEPEKSTAINQCPRFMSQAKEAIFKSSNYIWLYRLLGVMAAINIPWFRVILPAEAYDPMWIRWTFTGILLSLIAYSRVRRLRMASRRFG